MTNPTNVKKFLLPYITVIFVSIFPAVFLYCNNAYEAGFLEIVKPLLWFFVIGTIVYCALLFIIREANKASIVTCLFMIIGTNFSMIEKLFVACFQNLRYWHTVPIILVLVLILSIELVQRLPKDLAQIIVTSVCIMMTGLLALNIGMNIPDMMQYAQAQDELNLQEKEGVSTEQVESNNGLSNIYLMIFDEYAGFNQMEKYYGYDNKVLKDFLEENNFTISYDSHNEYYHTDVCLTNLMNLEYLVQPETSSAEKEIIRKNGKLFKLMEEQGYHVQVVETGNFFGQYSPTRNIGYDTASTINGETLADICYQRTILYPFLKKENSLIAETVGVCEYMADINNIPSDKTFTIFYISLPHQPFLVDENGKSLPPNAYMNWENNEYYLGQYKYATKLMITILENIVQNDANSIIVLQSDHGARASGTELFLKKFSAVDMTNILNAVYVGGENAEYIKGQSAINTFRLVLKNELGLDMEVIEVPDYT